MDGSPMTRLDVLERQMLREALNCIWPGSMSDLQRADNTIDGEQWGARGTDYDLDAPPFRTEAELTEFRRRSRLLAKGCPYAISALANRISYIVGFGHSVSVEHDDPKAAEAAEEVLEEFARKQGWALRQRENQLRADRDGEVFLRFFPRSADEGFLAVRYIEPRCVTGDGVSAEHADFGVQTKADDVETVEAYWVRNGDAQPEPVEPDEVQHRKYNTTSEIKRGFPLLVAIEANLERAESLLRTMSIQTKIQAAFAVIKKITDGTQDGISRLAGGKPGYTVTNSTTGGTTRHERIEPGKVMYASGNVDYQFPSTGNNAANGVAILSAELRSGAAALVMPEYMFGADASNNNYASALVAGTPAEKNFECLQEITKHYDREVYMRVLKEGVRQGRIREAWLDGYKLKIEAPGLTVRDGLKDAQQDEKLIALKIKSRKTAQLERGLDPTAEDDEIEKDRENDMGATPLPGLNDPAGQDPNANPAAEPGADGEPQPKEQA